MVFRIGFAITTTILGRVGPIRSDYTDPYMLSSPLLLLLLLWCVVGVALIGIVAMGHDATQRWCWLLCDVMVEIQSRSVRQHDDDGNIVMGTATDDKTEYRDEFVKVRKQICRMSHVKR
jgi:hypothetical protein